ncbi:MAG TPA: protein phosphatase 2C domain-containing protein [Caulobacteraceae bacterium]|nr:protein phosphatase 2C domain-containing protein [Caulobacteraceae bacterium]
MTPPGLRLVDAARTDPGRIRAVNEDSHAARPDQGLWAVADGMGGHENGQWASRTLVGALAEAVLSGDFEADSLKVADAIHAANAVIHAEAREAGKTMGTTAAALLVRDRRFAVLWAGDSRVYLLREGVLHHLTRDHTQVQDMVDRGMLTPEEAAHHPMSHVISRAVGVEASLEVDVIVDQAAVGDVFMLCSDGLYNVVGDPLIADVLGADRPARACERLVAAALAGGAPDNVTVIAVACDPITLLTLAPIEPP